MLEPRQADVPLLFLVLVVLPVVVYILLGRWTESSKRKESIEIESLVQDGGLEEAYNRTESMASSTSTIIPPAPPPTSAIRVCATCNAPATTRCSRCKFVRYCSGKCQIIHWRQGHKGECRPVEESDSSFRSPSTEAAGGGRDFVEVTVDSPRISKPERKISEKRVSRKSSTEGSSRKLSSNSKLGANSEHGVNGSSVSGGLYTDRENSQQQSRNKDLCSARRGMDAKEIVREYTARNVNYFRPERNCTEEVSIKNNVAEMATKNVLNPEGKSPKVMSRAVQDKGHSSKVRKAHSFDDSGIVKDIGLKKSSKISRQDASQTKVQVLFPYEEFTKFFNHDVFDLTPRGLLNCGNSCYANAVLQCLTCTKPLVTYLLSGTHSKTRCLKNWCLMCELEQHVKTLTEPGGPLSPSRILTYIRNINSQIGDGSQEDAHEFLRLLVASMQSICLEEAGGETQVHPDLQETTFIQQTFGGRLRSMVECLRCHHISERYENIMDLSLEIFGWVESLEDALTQFTTPEDLDGENMYRCGRCASYVRARKQLSIDEAPNILTIVLKRFQEGNYGKINKCITFPEMLDMIPYMTGINDGPPLYVLYGVVVHVDTLNASFSGHYVSYVKDLQGNWFRIDDSVVQPVPTSQVMSEGAYILFYMRSSPRPPRAYTRKPPRHEGAKPSRPRTRNPSDTGQTLHRANNRYTPAMETYSEPNPIQFSDPASSDWSLFTSSDDASFTSESTRDSFSTDTCNTDLFSSGFDPAHSQRQSQRTISCRMFSGSNPVTRYVSEEKGFVQIGGIPEQGGIPSLNPGFMSDNISGYQNFVNYETYDGDDFRRTFSNCHL